MRQKTSDANHLHSICFGSLLVLRCPKRPRKNASAHECKEGTDIHTTVRLGVPMSVKHTFRWKDGYQTKQLTPLRALRNRCLDCCNWSVEEVKGCLAKDCAAWVFRSGRDPSRKGVGDAANLRRVPAGVGVSGEKAAGASN